MKRIATLLTTFALVLGLFPNEIQAQAPDKMSYQAVVRNASDNLVSNQLVGMQIWILQGSPTGAAVFVETHTPTTNINGLVSIEIGAGTLVSGSFSSIDWSNGPYFIKTETDPAGGVNYTITGTSQFLSVPYALHAETVTNSDDADADPANEIQILSSSGGTVSLSNGGGSFVLNDDDPANEMQTLSVAGSDLTISGTGGNTVTLPSGGTLDDAYDFGGAGMGRTITADASEVSITTATPSGIALRVENTNTGVGIIVNSNNASNTFSAVQSSTNSNSSNAAAVTGTSLTGLAWGLAGQAAPNSTTEAASYGSNLRTTGGHGLLGIGYNGAVGQTNYSSGYAMYGENFDAIAPLGNGVGVAGKGYYGVLGEDRYLGGVGGAYGVYSNGNLGATGTKTFRIDHPQDPENKFLVHFSMESEEVLNVYRGTATFDANGDAVIELPDYFSEINRNVSYQLTPVGAYMPLFVKEKVNGTNQFLVSGGIAGKEVSWAVFAERNDLYLQQNPEQRDVELEKRPQEQGKYLMPELYNAGEDKAIFPSSIKKVAQRPLDEIKE